VKAWKKKLRESRNDNGRRSAGLKKGTGAAAGKAPVNNQRLGAGSLLNRAGLPGPTAPQPYHEIAALLKKINTGRCHSARRGPIAPIRAAVALDETGLVPVE
jgi:hypothetical protein